MRRSSRSGYTIIEVLVAAVILAIALPSLVFLVVGARKVGAQTQRFEAGTAAGQRIIEQIAIKARPSGTAAVTGNAVVREGNVDYTVNYTLTPFLDASASTPLGGWKMVATINWAANGGKTAHSTVITGVVP